MTDKYTIQEKYALEEISHLQSIIGRQDDLKAKCKGLAATLFTALTIAYTSNKLLDINNIEYVFTSLLIIFLFLLIESVYGVTEINAENRVREIEAFLRDDSSKYDGPAICNSLIIKLTFENLKKAARRERTYYLYLALSIIVALIALIS